MEEPTAYRWDFERSSWDSSGLATTFSVGIWQWLPKAGSKGLKRSKTIRVNGYTAEPERVYAKARELCERLNAEGASAENPPAWLQKQYSVPRPADLPAEPASEEVTGSQVRALRRQVMQRSLEPVGFVHRSGGTWTRIQGVQVHLIDFQPNQWGHDYTVNLGFHYTFVPAYFRPEVVENEGYHLLDCALSARLGYFGAEGKDVWFEYGSDREQLAATLEQNARDALAVFDRYARKWEDPAGWLSTRLADEAARSADLGYWQLRWPELFQAAIAVHLGKRSTAELLLEKLLERVDHSGIRESAAGLLHQARSM